MKLLKKEKRNITEYFDGDKIKYRYYYNIGEEEGTDFWDEYDNDGNVIRRKDKSGYEYWKEYTDGRETRFIDSNDYEVITDYLDGEWHNTNSKGGEYWSKNHPDNPKNQLAEDVLVDEKDIKPFEF